MWQVAVNPFSNVATNPNSRGAPLYPHNALQMSVQAKQCAPLMGCAGPGMFEVDPTGKVWKWSDVATWEAVYQSRSLLWDIQANPNNTFPVNGEHVEIPGGFHIELDVPPCRTHPEVPNCIPVLGRLTVTGRFTFDDGADREVSVDTILVWGEMEVGTKAAPFTHSALITFNGDPKSDTLVASEMHFMGSKVLAVFGKLVLHGKARETRSVKLLQTAFAGSSQLTLLQPTDWQVGDEVVVASTSYSADEIETATIVKLSADNRTVYLQSELNHTHRASVLQLGSSRAPERLAASVGILTGSNIVLDSLYTEEMLDAGWSTHGFHVVVGEHIYKGAADVVAPRRGELFASGVNFRHCGQTGSEHPCIMMRYFSGMSAKYEVFDWFFEKNDSPNNKIVKSTFQNTLNGAVKGVKAFGFLFDKNVVHRTYRNAIDLDASSEDATITNNFIVGSYRSPGIDSDLSFCKKDESCLIKPISAIYIVAERIRAISGNIIAGVEDTGITAVWQESCSGGSVWDASSRATRTRFSGNELFGGMVGIRLLPTPGGKLAITKCVALNEAKVWLMSDVGILTLDQGAKVQIGNVVVSDCNVGISLNFIRGGSDNTMVLKDSVVAGSATSSCSDAGSCRSYGSTDVLAKRCNSIFGRHRVGIALPRFTTEAQTCGADDGASVCRPVTRPVKQCAAPWLKRYGIAMADRSRMEIKNTIFYKFKESDCGSTSRAIATLADEHDLAPELHLNGIEWIQTDLAARFKLGYDRGFNPGACSKLCNAVNFGTARDLDGSTTGIAGSTMVSAQLPELTSGSGQCTYSRDTLAYVCDNDYNSVLMTGMYLCLRIDSDAVLW